MKGIAITLATREDAEAIDRIEKLIGHKIPRSGGGSEKQTEAPKAEKPAKAEKRPSRAAAHPKPERTPEPKAERTPEVKPERTPEPKTEPVRTSKPDLPADRSPVVEDLKSDWNGPMPSFLSVSAV